MTTYGNLRTANEDKTEIKHGSVGGEHPAKTDGTHRTHTLGGDIAKPQGGLTLRHHTLGGALGNGAITDCYGTTPMKIKGSKAGGSVGEDNGG